MEASAQKCKERLHRTLFGRRVSTHFQHLTNGEWRTRWS